MAYGSLGRNQENIEVYRARHAVPLQKTPVNQLLIALFSFDRGRLTETLRNSGHGREVKLPENSRAFYWTKVRPNCKMN